MNIMANTIAKAFVQQFQDNLIHLAQQKGSRLRASVNEQSVTGEKFHFERLGVSAAVIKSSRHTNTPVLEVPHSRRTATMTDYHWADLIDDEDKVRMLVSPESHYAKSGANSMARAFDDLIIAAATGNAVDGDGSNVALPAGQKIAHGSAGLTLAKLISAKEILDGNDVDPDEERFFVLGSQQVSNLLNTTEVKSADYNSIKALVQGDIDTFMGFKFLRSERLNLASTQRKCFAFTKGAMGLGIGKDVTTKIDLRPDKSYAHQVYLSFVAGATRVQDECVVEVLCTES
jgi:hypothetical protein